MGLCSGFVLEAVLVMQGCFGYRWAGLAQSQGLFCSSPRQRAGWGCARGREGTQPGELTQGISHTVRRHAQQRKVGGRRRKGRKSRVMAFAFPGHRYA